MHVPTSGKVKIIQYDRASKRLVLVLITPFIGVSTVVFILVSFNLGGVEHCSFVLVKKIGVGQFAF